MIWLLCSVVAFADPISPTYFLPDAVPDEAGQASVGAMAGVGYMPLGDFPVYLYGGVARAAVAPVDDWQATGWVAGFYESSGETFLGHAVAGGVTGAWSTRHQAQHFAAWAAYGAGMNFDEVAPSGAGGLGVSADLGAARGIRFDASIPVFAIRRHRASWSVLSPIEPLAASEVGISWSAPRDRFRVGAHSGAVTGFSYRHQEPRWMIGGMVGTTALFVPSVLLETGLRI